MSSNGIFVGLQKIPQNKPIPIKDSDVVGFGLTVDAKFTDVVDSEKFIFKLVKQQPVLSISNRIKFQSENELDNLEEKVKAFDGGQSPLIDIKPNLKRKLSGDSENIQVKCEIKESCKNSNGPSLNEDVINIISDSENETNIDPNDKGLKKFKLEKPISELQKCQVNVKAEQDFLKLEAFNKKQEYLRLDDEPIQVDSESDSESEHWFMRLSQNSPGKPFTKISHRNRDKNMDTKKEDNSYSQVEDEVSHDYSNNIPSDEDEDFVTDLISIPLEPPNYENQLQENQSTSNQLNDNNSHEGTKNVVEINSTISSNRALEKSLVGKDTIDGVSCNTNEIQKSLVLPPASRNDADIKKTQIIEPPVQITKKKSVENKSKSSSKKSKTSSSSKRNISNSQKEERKKKLKEIADKEKKEIEKNTSNIEKKEIEQIVTSNATNNATKSTVNIKMTNINRGAFLSNNVPCSAVKPMKRKESPQKTKEHKDNKTEQPPKDLCSGDLHKTRNKGEKPIKEHDNRHHKSSKSKDKHKSSKHKSKHDKIIIQNTYNSADGRVPLKCLKPLTESVVSLSGNPFSKVEPLPPKKPKKTVSFSEIAPEIRLFEIEPGNKMKKTSLVKSTLLDVQHMPMFSLEKLTLMKVLRWNPQWLEEQINNNDPPPILGHHNPPMAIFHSFKSHNQYVQLVGDLLLMEIWECLTLTYMKIRNQKTGLQMKIASLPPVPTHERCYEISNISVDVSLPTTEIMRSLPKVGEILLVTFGDNCRRFFFVHSIRCLPSPSRNIHSFYNISLHATFTEKMKLLRPGEMVIGVRLAYIHKELNLFEAMAYLANSPLSRAILTPEPQHFDIIQTRPINSPWTNHLNESQRTAVTSSVAAALGDQPCIQMVQGPPGTGKSYVVASIVMAYFYDEDGKRHQNRGKILICATSNAAVDGLIIKLLNIRQNLPKNERFRMVRVGRPEAMHERARDVSSQQLAQRDAARLAPDAAHHAAEEILRLQAKINMWRTAALNAKDPVRVAYCESRITEIIKRIDLLRGSSGGGAGDELRPEQLALAERRIIEGADIVVSTLSSVHNHKMRGLRRRIALCIVDEAGQAIEPESLLPLTLDVTRLTLVGDPQQLPGYICSQRAKRHGLGESLFSRLTSCAEQWPRSPVVLLQQQYRMHEHIADYPNRAFYDGRLLTAPAPRPLLPAPPYVVLGVASGDKGQGASGVNEMEAWGVCRLAGALAGPARRLGLQLAVITPYHAHKDAIKRNLRLLQDT